MKKSSLFSCTVLSCMLFTGLGVASAAAETKSDLPKPVVVVAPDDVPRRFANTTIRVGLTLDEKGCPSNIRVITPDSGYLEKSVVAAVNQWRFTPMMKDGVPVAQSVVLPITIKSPAI